MRHKLADRLFHWTMAASVLALGGSAFLPLIGIKFDWIPIHWISGIILFFTVLFHLMRVFFVHGISAMIPGADDCRELARTISSRFSEPRSDSKYDAYQKGYHLASATTIIALLVTGLPMLAKIDTVFWRRDPSILSDQTWGIIYAVHGVTALFLLFLVILHVYFAFLPEHRVFLISMIKGPGPKLTRKARE